MRRTGWTKNWRKKWDNPTLRGRINHLVVWDWILSHAEWHKEIIDRAEVRFNGNIYRLKLGQLTCGSIQIASDTGAAASTVRRVINDLVGEQLLEHQTDRRCSLITVKNWEQYQDNEQLVSSQRAASEQLVSTKEEGKKGRREENTSTNPLDPKTTLLWQFIDDECKATTLINAVSIRALDIPVRRYNTLQLRVEVRKCMTWLVEKGHKQITASRLSNWFAKSVEINKRTELRQLEYKQASKDPYIAAKMKVEMAKKPIAAPAIDDPSLNLFPEQK